MRSTSHPPAVGGYASSTIDNAAIFARVGASSATLDLFSSKADERRDDPGDALTSLCRTLVDEQTRLLRCIDDCASRKATLSSALENRQAQRSRRNAGIATLSKNVDAMCDDRQLRRMKFEHEKKELYAEAERAKTVASAIRTRIAQATRDYNDAEDELKATTVATLSGLDDERTRLKSTINRMQGMLERRTAEHDKRRATLQHYTRMLLNFAQTEVGSSMAVVPTYADAAGAREVDGTAARRATILAQAASSKAQAAESAAAADAAAAAPEEHDGAAGRRSPRPPPRDLAGMSGWSSGEVRDWVRDDLRLPGAAPAFFEHGVDGAQLLRMTAGRAGTDLGLTQGELGVLFTQLQRARDLAEAHGAALLGKRPYVEWTVDDLAKWVGIEIELPQYDELFRTNRLSGAALPQLSDAALEKMGITHSIHRRKIARAAAAEVARGAS